MYRLLLVCLSVVTAACASTADDSELDQSEGELRFSDVETFKVRRTSGFAPAGPAGTCRGTSGQWTVDFVNRKIAGQGCVNGRMSTIDRHLTTDEHVRLRKTFFQIRTARRPEMCPTDVPVTSLDVVRRTREDHYVEARSACGSATPVTSESIGALLDLVTGLTSGPQVTAE